MKRLLHLAVAAFQAMRRTVWFVTRPRTLGVHAIPLTPEGRLVLVRLSYAPGWRLPGGGMKRGEEAEGAVLRELREEIGMTDFRTVTALDRFEHRPDFRRGSATLFLVEGVVYHPRWSLEVMEVADFKLDALPQECAAVTHELLARWRRR